MSLMEILNTRQVYDPDPPCPACGRGFRATSFKFTTYRHMRDGQGHLVIDIQAIGGGVDPHLIVECLKCGADWEMECYT